MRIHQQEPPEPGATESTRTTNYRSQLGDFSNANWGWIVAGGFALFLLILIRRAFRR